MHTTAQHPKTSQMHNINEQEYAILISWYFLGFINRFAYKIILTEGFSPIYFSGKNNQKLDNIEKQIWFFYHAVIEQA